LAEYVTLNHVRVEAFPSDMIEGKKSGEFFTVQKLVDSEGNLKKHHLPFA
jgi:hypothetical protein